MLGLEETTGLLRPAWERTLSDTSAAKSFSVPIGFRFGAVAAGVKQAGAARRDLALIVSDVPCAAAGVVHRQPMRAAPVRLRRRAAARAADIRAIVANSGNANAIVGPRGAADERAIAKAVAEALGVDADAVLTASTGAIGMPLPVDRIAAAVPALVAALGDDVIPAAEAIRTTDLRTKVAFREIDVGGKAVKFAAIAKGSGMIHPQMATMLCFITTDATVAPAVLQAALAEAVEETFNTITVDGDMSTNDTVIALANGRAGAPAIERDGAELHEAAGDAGRPVQRPGARHRRRRRGGQQAADRRRRGRARAGRGPRSRAGRRRRQPGEVRASSAAIRRGAGSWRRSARAWARAACRSTWRA